MAAKLGIDDLRFDWRRAIEELRPDIVAIATPGIVHREMALFAAQHGCHMLCDKPLGLDAGEATDMLSAVEAAGVKHAYAASSRYAPACQVARETLVDGYIGELREVESIINLGFSRLAPYNWMQSLDQGGGVLNNALPHQLGQALYITGGDVEAVVGEAEAEIERAPVGERIHDFRQVFGQTVAVDESTEWRTVDGDSNYRLMAHLDLPDGRIIPALFKFSLYTTGRHSHSLALYGEQGTLHVHGGIAPTTVEYFNSKSGEWTELSIAEFGPTPDDGGVQRNWNRLVAEFVAHIRGTDSSVTYPTFGDGWLNNQIIDIVRSGAGWTPLPDRADHLLMGHAK